MSILQHLSSGNSAPCLILPDRVMSYADVHAQTEKLLRRLGRARRLLALEACASPEFIFTYLAALRAGYPVALLPPGQADAWKDFHDVFQPEISFRTTPDGCETILHADRPAQALHSDLALMLATSGSEGKARWVRLSRTNLEANADSIVSYLGLSPADRVPLTLPFHYSYGLSILNTHLAAGGSLAFCGDSVIEPAFLATAAALGCTGLSGVPYTFELLERLGFRDRIWPELRYMTVAGGRLSPQLVRTYDKSLRARGARFFVMYGQTEATARMSFVPPEVVGGHADCIGIPIPGGTFRISGWSGRTVSETGRPGELLYSGPNVMMGYATRRQNLALGSEIRELATGDIATRTEDGLFRLEGRASRFSKVAGLRVGHESVEWALRARGITCAVTGTDQALTIHLEGTAGPEIAALAAEIAGIPARCIRLKTHAALPRLASGKIDYVSLRTVAAPEPAVAADSLVEDYRAAFYPKPVTPADSFESLEGDSLAYVQTSLAVENRLGFLPAAWEQIPIEQLEKLKPATDGPESGRTSRIESHVVLRAAAILLIVVHHATSLPIPGGAAALMLMVGYGFARFHGEQLFAGRTSAFLVPMLRNLLPYFMIVAGFAAAWQAVPWASVLLIGNLGFADPGSHTMLPYQFWFVEAYAQQCLLMAAAFSIPAVRRSISRHPFGAAMLFLLFAFSLRYGVPLVYDIGNRKIFFPTYVFWFTAMGWCAYFATDRHQRLALLLVAAILCPVAAYTGGNWQGAWVLYMLVLGVLAILLLIPYLRLPRIVIPGVMLISAASYHIYLFHRIVPEILNLDAAGSLGPIASITAGLLSGIAAMSLQRHIFSRLSRSPRWAAQGA